MALELKVKYACLDGLHIFTGKSTLTKGVCAAHKNLELAFGEVSIQLETLLKQNHNIDCEVAPSDKFEDFTRWLESATHSGSSDILPIPGAVIDWDNCRAA